MDWEAFKGLAWLQGATEDSRITEAREKIGNQWGWGNEWYTEEDNLATLFGFLSAPEPRYEEDGRPGSGERPELLNELDALPDAEEGEQPNEDERATWLTAVANDVYWDQFWVVPENRYDEPEFSEPYGMYYRYDKLTEVYEWNTDPQTTPDAWISQEDADAQIAAAAEQQPEGGSAEEEYSEPVWDENWQMLYRAGPGGVYQYAYSDDRLTVRPGAQWLSYDEVMQGTGASAEAPAEERTPAEVTMQAMADLTGQVRQANPELAGVDEEELQRFVAGLMQERLAALGGPDA